MKKTFKLVSILLVISMLFAFASCKPQETNKPTVDDSEVVSSTKPVVPGENGTLVVSVGVDLDHIPYKYKDGEKLVGINIDFMKAVADKLGMYVKYVETDTLSSQATTEKVDVIINQSNSDMLDIENATFSKKYVSDIQSVIVKASSDYKIYDDFYSAFDSQGYPVGVIDGFKIGVKSNTTGDFFASAPLDEWGFGQENVKEYETTDEMINAVKNGEITAVVIDDAIARKAIDSVSGLKILESSFYSADYQIAVVTEDAEKNEQIINAINELVADGTAKSIVDKYMN